VTKRKGQAAGLSQPSGLKTLLVDAGYLCSFSGGLLGRRTSSPLQLGHRLSSALSAQERQKVHSNEQIIASTESAGRSRSQHSQLGRIWSIARSFVARLGFSDATIGERDPVNLPVRGVRCS
jgi:hypothetical protein